MQSRDGDLKEFFANDILSFPEALSDFGKLHLSGTKPELLKCFEQPETCDCKVLGVVVIVHCLPITGIVTINEYADTVCIP
jgi:hypothetical protein